MENLKSLLDQRFFLLTRQGMKSLDFSRVVLEDLGSCSDVLTNIADNIVRKEERLFKARGHVVDVSFLNNNSLYASVQLKKLRISCEYNHVDGNGGASVAHMYPSFVNRAGNANAPRNYTLEWNIPAGIKAYIVFHILGGRRVQNDNATTSPGYGADNAWLVCQIDGEDGQFMLPLPNLYDDGRICFGAPFVRKETIQECVENDLDSFYSTTWNSDLMTDEKKSKVKKLIRFKTSDNSQLPPVLPGVGMKGLLTTVGNTEFEDFPFMTNLNQGGGRNG